VRIIDNMEDRTVDLGPHLVSGVIDNSEKGRTTGHLVLDGIEEPVTLDLAGNARPDLAGCVVKFRNLRHSQPVESDVAELLDSPQRGTAVRISAVARGATNRAGGESVSPLLRLGWLNFGILIRFVVEADNCEFDVDLPRWTLSEDEVALQKREFESALAVFRQLWEEFEEDALDEEIRDDQFQKIDAILPQLEATESDEEKLALMRKALGPDVSEYELQGLFEAYFFTPSDPQPASDAGEDWTAGLVPVDDDLKALAESLDESVRLLAFRLESEEVPDCLEEFAESLKFLMIQLLVGSPLDRLDGGGLKFDPEFMLRRLEEERKSCESVIAYLELEGTPDEKIAFRDQVWPLRKPLEELIKQIRSRTPESPPLEKGKGSDIPF